MEITKEQVQAYEDVRQEGLVNMFDVNSVIQLSCGILTKEMCLEIMGNYATLIEKHEIERY